jgi:hypothetical protein
MGGTDDIDNLVSLLPEEHYIAHLLLLKMYALASPDVAYKLASAVNMMKRGHTGKRNNKSVGYARRLYAKHHPAKHENVKEKIRAGLHRHRATVQSQYEFDPFKRVCLVSFCKHCGKTIPNKAMVYCSRECRKHKFTDEVKATLSHTHKTRLAALSKEENSQRVRNSIYKNRTKERQAEIATKIKYSKSKENERILNLTDDEFYTKIAKMSLYRKDGLRNGNLVRWLTVRGIAVDEYYNSRV